MNLSGFPKGLKIDPQTPWAVLEQVPAWFAAKGKASVATTARLASPIDLTGEVWIDEGAIILPFTIISGPAYIGKRARIGPHATIREYSIIAAGVHIGHASEVKASVVGAKTLVAHLSYIGDSVLGRQVSIAAGVTLANFRFDQQTVRVRVNDRTSDSGRIKLGAIIGDETKLGVNSATMPGTVIGSRCTIGPGVTIKGFIPDNKVISSSNI